MEGTQEVEVTPTALGGKGAEGKQVGPVSAEAEGSFVGHSLAPGHRAP